MASLSATLVRLHENKKQTLGALTIYEGLTPVFSCVTLERPDLNNQPFVSRILAGDYILRARFSAKYGNHYQIFRPCGSEIIGRELILVHWGNFFRDTTGCVLVGENISDIDGDGYRDITRSKATFRALMETTKSRDVALKIIDFCGVHNERPRF